MNPSKLQVDSSKGKMGIENQRLGVARIKITHNLNNFLQIVYLTKYKKKKQ